MHARPDEVKLLLIDLKRVELAPYDGLPHLLQHVIVEPFEAKAALNWAVHEMEERYKRLAGETVRNLASYNEKVGRDAALPYVVLVIDELADLIMREGRKVEDSVVKIAQKARAVGIHLVLATQRPSVNVVTGLIKANVPSRIAFAMSSMVDSRTVLDQPGAEDLIGRGDMLYQPVDLPRPLRMQGVFVSDREVAAVTEHWRRQAPEPDYDDSVLAFTEGDDSGGAGQFSWLAKLADDEMAVRAAEVVTTAGRASTSMLQTKLKVGFNRASRLIDILERYGIVAPQDPRSPASHRQVYGPDNWFRSQDDIDRD
jgi:DNA segregation ATPase FtsK/SpoIIIE, S-DNA-T family